MGRIGECLDENISENNEIGVMIVMGDNSLMELVIGDARDLWTVEDESVHLVVTSPPYWQIKDYGVEGQIGWGQSYEDYITSLGMVFRECNRALHPGCRMCINIGDQFLRAKDHGRHRVAPIHADITVFCTKVLGLDFMGEVVWRKVSTCRPSGGGRVMGSYPYPRNGVFVFNYEYILVFRKQGAPPRVESEIKERAKMSRDEWVENFYAPWSFLGRRGGHTAEFPEELPRRLIRMFSFPGETVLDPFLGSGTTMVVAAKEGRRCVGYEINPTMEACVVERLLEVGFECHCRRRKEKEENAKDS